MKKAEQLLGKQALLAMNPKPEQYAMVNKLDYNPSNLAEWDGNRKEKPLTQ